MKYFALYILIIVNLDGYCQKKFNPTNLAFANFVSYIKLQQGKDCDYYTNIEMFQTHEFYLSNSDVLVCLPLL
jgi:hypothetical protein